MLCRLTYDASLAELTSLEEMMRIMMNDGHVHSDVIAKLPVEIVSHTSKVSSAKEENKEDTEDN